MTPDLNPTHDQFLVYKTDDSCIKLDVRFKGETVWLTQPMLAELFQTTQQNISQQSVNIYDEQELAPEAIHKKFLLVSTEKTTVCKTDIMVAKNYLTESEQLSLNNLVEKLDGFLRLNDSDILTHTGKISHNRAKQHADFKYKKFYKQQFNQVSGTLETLGELEKSIIKKQPRIIP